jgi:uncharacterized protein (DUF952 family)
VPLILHIAHEDAWQAAQSAGVYRLESLDTEGFIHCSTLAQAVDTASRYYRGVSGLVLLCIDERRLTAECRYEGATERFPHIYGPLNLDAVVRVVPFPCAADGSFFLPAAARYARAQVHMRVAVEVLGVHPVADSREPCHLIEVAIAGEPMAEVIETIAQEAPGRPEEHGQAPYDEHYLSADGLRAAEPAACEGRVVFFLHDVALDRPLRVAGGSVPLPAPTPRPTRLDFMEYETPC